MEDEVRTLVVKYNTLDKITLRNTTEMYTSKGTRVLCIAQHQKVHNRFSWSSHMVHTALGLYATGLGYKATVANLMNLFGTTPSQQTVLDWVISYRVQRDSGYDRSRKAQSAEVLEWLDKNGIDPSRTYMYISLQTNVSLDIVQRTVSRWKKLKGYSRGPNKEWLR